MSNTPNVPGSKLVEVESRHGILRIFVYIAVALFSIAAAKTVEKGEPLSYMLPNFLLFTPFHRLSPPIWDYLDPCSRLPPIAEHKLIRSMNAEDYTLEKFAELTENYRYPAVVRGMFKNSTALKMWTKKGYLSDKIGHHEIKVAWRTTNETKIFDRIKYTFKGAYEDLLSNEDYKGWLFFPYFASTKNFVKANPLNYEVNTIIQEDLDLDKIWKGFGHYDTHSTMVGHQFSMGRAKPNQKGGTTTLDWHCEPGSNWFVQISGQKHWYFMDPKYSSYMMTNHTGIGIRVLRSSNGHKMRDLHDRLPLEKVVLNPGDLLFNPEWEWHTIRRDVGVSIAVAMREFNYTKAFRNNAQYTGVIGINHFWKNIGVEKFFRRDWFLH